MSGTGCLHSLIWISRTYPCFNMKQNQIMLLTRITKYITKENPRSCTSDIYNLGINPSFYKKCFRRNTGCLITWNNHLALHNEFTVSALSSKSKAKNTVLLACKLFALLICGCELYEILVNFCSSASQEGYDGTEHPYFFPSND